VELSIELLIHSSYGQGKSGKNQRIRENQGILHSKIRENSEDQGKSGNLKVPGCKSQQTVYNSLKFFSACFACIFVPPLLHLFRRPCF